MYKNTLLILSIILLSIISLSLIVPITYAATPKPLQKIEYLAYSDDNKGLLALSKGDVDVYIPSKPISEDDLKAAGIDPSTVKIARTSGGIAVMLFNFLTDEDELGKLGIVTDPDGKKHFNPVAFREIRYALNLLINRKYIAEKVVGLAYPAFVTLSPSLPYYSEVEKVIKDMGFKPEGNLELAKKIIDDKLTQVSQELKKHGYELTKKQDGFWYFKAPGQDEVKVKIIITTWWESYTYHCGAMRYFAQQLKEVGFDAEVHCGHARKYRDAKDWRYMHWHIYTYRRVISEDLLRIWFVDGMYWTYSSAAIPRQLREHLEKMGDTLQPQIDKLTEEVQKAKTLTELLDGVKKLVKLVMEQSIVVAYVNPLRTIVISNRVHDAVVGWASGVYNPWFYRTAWTDTGILRIGLYSSEMDITTPINPTLAMHRLSRAVILMPTVDVGVFPNPYSGELAPLRVSWAVKDAASLNPNALYFDPTTHSWTTVKDAERKGLLNATKISKEHLVKITLNYVLGKWHHGRDMKLADILLWLAWNLDWMNNATKNDKWYFVDPDEHPIRWSPQSLTCLYGIEIVNDTSLSFYTSTDCMGITDPDLLAEEFVSMVNTWGPRSLWPWFPPELMMSIGYLKIYGGPVSGKQYILVGQETENVKRIDLTDPNCVEDLKAAAEKIANGEYMPPFIEATLKLADKYPAIGKPDLKEGAKKLVDFANKYNNMLVSHGQYIVTEYKPDRIVFTRFTGYPRTLDSFFEELTAYKLELKSITPTKAVVEKGKSTEITLELVKVIIFPEEQTGEKPADQAYIVARILKEGKEVAIVQGVKVEPGKFAIKLTPDVTNKLETGTYQIEILYGISQNAPLSKMQATLLVLPPASTTTTTTTTTASPVQTSTTTTPTHTTTTTPTGKTTTTQQGGGFPTLYIVIAIIVIIIIIAAVLLMKKK